MCVDWAGASVPLVETWADPRNLGALALYAGLAAATWHVARRPRAGRAAAIDDAAEEDGDGEDGEDGDEDEDEDEDD